MCFYIGGKVEGKEAVTLLLQDPRRKNVNVTPELKEY